MSQGIRLMGLWAKQAKNGETYHEGSLGGGTVRIFVNNYKRTDKDPDVVMYLSPKPKPDQRANPGQVRGNVVTPRPQAQQPAPPQMAPQKTAYVDHTKGGYGAGPDDPVPWPDGEEMPF